MVRHITTDDEVMVDGEWFPVSGFSLMHKPGEETTGSVFTLKPIGKFEPCLGYRIDYSTIRDVRRALSEQEKPE